MKNPVIVIVEDEVIIATDIKEILMKEGYDCVANIATYNSAIQAIETYQPDLVLVDIILKKEHEGIRVGSYLQKKGCCPYIYLTSLSDKQTIMEVKNTFPFGYIVKPFKPQDLITNVALALNNFKHLAVDVNKVQSPVTKDDVPLALKKVVSHIQDNINEKIQLADLVALTRWKEHHFIKTFSQYLKVTPHQYIIRCKIERFMVLIETTSLPAPDIAFELGFNSYSNFSRIFKKNMDMTVEQYRKKIRIAKNQRP